MRAGLRQRVADRSVYALRNPQAPAAAVFPITCAATQPQLADCSRKVRHNCDATQAQLALVTRTTNHTIAATQAQVAVVLRSVGHTIPATQAQAALVVRTVNHTCTATQAQVALVVAYIPRPGGGGYPAQMGDLLARYKPRYAGHYTPRYRSKLRKAKSK